MSQQIKVTTGVDLSQQLIAQRVDMVDNQDIWPLITREVIRLKDAGVRQALIRFGWTPPPDGFVPQ